jgi:hypothetical protein
MKWLGPERPIPLRQAASVKTSERLFAAKIYSERLSPSAFDEIMTLFEDFVNENLETLLTDLQPSRYIRISRRKGTAHRRALFFTKVVSRVAR